MPDAKFDLGDYVEVKDRIRLFYELYANGRLCTDQVEILTAPDGAQRVMVRAHAYRTPDDPRPGVGHSWLAIPGTTPYTKGSEVENAETSAWGRAIGALGILIDRSIATSTEIEAKGGDVGKRDANPDGSLIGIAQVGNPPSDYELRPTPTGHALSFRLTDGAKSIKVVAYDSLAEALALVKDGVIGVRVQCWGRVSDESFTPKNARPGAKPVVYQVLTLHRIQTPALTLPAPEAPSLPLFGEDAAAAWDAEIAARPVSA